MADKIIEKDGGLHKILLYKLLQTAAQTTRNPEKMELGDDFHPIRVCFIVILPWLLSILFHCRWVKEL